MILLYRGDMYRKPTEYDNVLEVAMPKVRGEGSGFAKLTFEGQFWRITTREEPQPTPGYCPSPWAGAAP